MASDRAVPEEVVALRAAATSPFAEPSDPNWRESELMVEYARLKSQVKRNLLSDDEIVRAAVDLETQSLTLSRQVTSSWQHKTVYVDEKSGHHYEAYYCIYTDEHLGKMWNVLRLTRILLCELISSRCPKPPVDPPSGSGQSSLEYYATTTIYQMSREICATVPQYIGDSSNFFCKDTTRTDLLPVESVQMHGFRSYGKQAQSSMYPATGSPRPK